MDNNMPQNTNSANVLGTDVKNPAILSAPKKDGVAINEKINPFGLKNLPLSVVSQKKSDIPVIKREMTAPQKLTDPEKAKPEILIPENTAAEPINIKETINIKEFRVPKKPETVKDSAVPAPVNGESLPQKSSVDLSTKGVGWKTLAPTIDLKPKESFLEKKEIAPVAKSIVNNTLAKKTETPDTTDVSALPTLRTYKNDIAGTIREQKTSLVRMVLEEQKNRAARELNESPESRKNLPLIFFSVIFFVLAASMVYYAFFRPNKDDVNFEKLDLVPLVRAENNKEISVGQQTAKELSKEIRTELSNANLKLDTLEYIYFTEKYMFPTENGEVEAKRILKMSKLFEILGIPIPPNFIRALKGDYMFGFHNFNKNQPFLILKTDYYDTAFAGMITWESTFLKDIFPLFGVSGAEALKNRTWTDVVIKNKDTRVLKDFNEQTVLAYMFKDQKTLIISTRENTLFEVARRLDLINEKK
jgi:hypothetical protein